MIRNHSLSLDTFGFALLVVLLLFYVLCSKEALKRLKPISLPAWFARLRPRRLHLSRVAAHRWEESLYFSRAPRSLV
jgi:hypothetical protein